VSKYLAARLFIAENSFMKPDIKGLPFGIQYDRAPTPFPQEWAADLPRIKELGFTCIQVRPQWRWHERCEGKFDWEDLDLLFDQCAKFDLKIVFQFMLETAPAWLYEKYHCERVDLFGNKIPPKAHGAFYVGGWLPCFDREEVRLEGGRFIRAAVERYRERTNLLLWEAWNEPRSRPVGECCCPASRREFRTYLGRRFGSIEDLNRSIGKAYGADSEIQPPAEFEGYTELALFRQWAMESVVSRVRWTTDTIRSIDGEHPVMAHVGANSLGQDILADSSDDFATARAVDFYGTSLLFFTGDFLEFDKIEGEAVFSSPRWREDYYVISMGADWLRSVSPYFWVNEIYTNSFFYTTPDVEGEDLRFRIWPYLAGGAKGVLFWQYKSERVGNESGCSGLVGIDGRTTGRAQACGIEARRVRRHDEFLRDFRPDPAEVAIVYDIESDLMSRIEEATGGNWLGNTVKYTYKASLKGSYNLFWQTRTPVDFVSTRELEKIHRYRIVYLPALFVADRRVAEILEAYVEKGGFLVSEEGLALRDWRYWMSTTAPGAGLDVLFGLTQGKTTKPAAASDVEFGRLRLPVVSRRANLLPRDGRIMAKWPTGEAAIVGHSRGKGTTVMLGFHPGLCYCETGARGYIDLAADWIKTAGVPAGLEVIGEDLNALVQWRSGQSMGNNAVFVMNYEDRPIRVRINLQGFTSPVYDLLSNAKVDSSGSALLVTLPARDIVCLVKE
jgi:beta-galactosidase GanA